MKISVASGKGGTGKTLLATNLAAYISKTNPVLLADLDVEEPNDLLFINGKLQNTTAQYKFVPMWNGEMCAFCNTCTENCRFNAVLRLGESIIVFNELCHSCFACSELCPSGAMQMMPQKIGETREYLTGNLRFIHSCLEIGEEQAVPLIHKTLQLVRDKYGDIPLGLFDCPPGTSCPMAAATKNADFVILVAEPTPFGFHDFMLSARTMQKLDKPFAVVINRSDMGDDALENYCISRNIPILAKIPFNSEILKFYSEGELVYGNCDVMNKELEKIAVYIDQLKLN